MRPPEDVMGVPLRVLVVGAAPDEAAPLLADLGRAGRLASAECVTTRENLHAALELGGFDLVVAHAAGLALLLEDVAERKSLELQLQRAQKLEAVGRLAGGIAHDFNNLLVAILGYSEVLSSHLKVGDPSWRYAEEIRKAGERAAALTKGLLAFTRGDVVDRKPIDVGAIVHDMAPMLERLLGEDVHLLTRCSAGTPFALADRGQVEQVLLNLAVNGRDAMPRGGTLSIATAEETQAEGGPTGLSPGRYVALSVRDTGTGMSPEVIAHLFEPFFTTKEEGKGTGLGLSVVYGIVKQSGGEVSVWSEVGRGTAITIYLPRTDASPAESPLPEATNGKARVGKETVLLVEDDEAVRAIAKEVLTDAGYRVIEASSGLEAKAICDRPEQSVHILLTDIVMPDLGGVDLAQAVSVKRPGLRVLLTSGYTARGIEIEKLKHVQAAFLQKPFRPDSLLRKVRQILDAAPTATTTRASLTENSAAASR